MSSLFWRLAFKLYNTRQPSVGFEVFAIGFGGAFAASYFMAEILNHTVANVLRLAVASAIVAIGVAHRQVRLERLKGPMALYQKMKAAKD